MISSTKSKILKRLVLSLLLMCIATFSSSRFSSASIASAQRARGEFMIVNKSDYTFAKLYLSPSSRRAWGADQLGRKIIRPGDSYTLQNIPCGLYDVKVIDEEGDSCIVTEIPMCRDHTHWEVTNDRLLSCQGFN